MHDTPEYNGVAERLNRTLVTKVRAMLHDSGLPKFLWGEAMLHATFLKNRTPTRVLDGTTPYEVFHGDKPDLSNLQVWGCPVRVHDTSGSKLDARMAVGRWVGFDEPSLAHRVYWSNRRIITVERSVKFNFDTPVVAAEVPLEGERVTKDARSDSTSMTVRADTNTNTMQKCDVLGSDFEPSHSESKRVRKPSAYVKRLRSGEGHISARPSDPVLPRGLHPGNPEFKPVEEELASAIDEWEGVEVEEIAMAAVMGDAEGLEPTFEEARRRPDWPKWDEAARAELESLKKNNTFSLIERPPGVNVVSSKWVLRIKKNAAGEIDKYKARLVARGFTQVYGIDYYDTFAPVAKLASFRLILAIAACNGWPAESFDFNSAYLNSTLDDDEVVYLEQPPFYAEKDPKCYVLRLHKALYGLKQGGRKWYEHLCVALADLGFKHAEADWGVFFARIGDDIIILVIHVDDCLITGSSLPLLQEYKAKVNAKYRMTDMGPVSWILGIRITRDLENRTLALSQHAYIDSILARFNFTDLKPVSIPLDLNVPLSKGQCPTTLADIARMKKIPYREAIGSLMYAAVGTRPDIAFAVSTLAQFSDNPGHAHWEATKCIFRYLLGTKKLSLVYGGDHKGLEGFVDADGASQDHRRAISGYVFLIDGGAVSWSSKKQELVTLSTTEAEYVAATHTAKEAMWIRRLIGEVFRPLTQPTSLHMLYH